MFGPLFDKPLVAIDTPEVERKIAEMEMLVEYLKKEVARRTGAPAKYGYLSGNDYVGFDTFAEAAEYIKKDPKYVYLPEEDRLYRIHKVYP